MVWQGQSSSRVSRCMHSPTFCDPGWDRSIFVSSIKAIYCFAVHFHKVSTQDCSFQHDRWLSLGIDSPHKIIPTWLCFWWLPRGYWSTLLYILPWADRAQRDGGQLLLLSIGYDFGINVSNMCASSFKKFTMRQA